MSSKSTKAGYSSLCQNAKRRFQACISTPVLCIGFFFTFYFSICLHLYSIFWFLIYVNPSPMLTFFILPFIFSIIVSLPVSCVIDIVVVFTLISTELRLPFAYAFLCKSTSQNFLFILYRFIRATVPARKRKINRII